MTPCLRRQSAYAILTQYLLDKHYFHADSTGVGRRRKAWLVGGNGKLRQRGRTLPGYYAMWNEYAANGRRTYRSKHFKTASVVRKWVKQFNARMDLGAIGEIDPVPYPTAIEEFLAGCSTLSHGTTVQYSGALGVFRVVVEDRNVHEIHGRDIDRFINWRLKESSEATVAKHIRGLRRFFRWCLKRGMTDHIPLDQATALPSDRSVRPKPVLTEKDLDRLVSKLDTEDRKLAVQLAVTTGLDRGMTSLTPCPRDVGKVNPHQYPALKRGAIVVRPYGALRLVSRLLKNACMSVWQRFSTGASTGCKPLPHPFTGLLGTGVGVTELCPQIDRIDVARFEDAGQADAEGVVEVGFEGVRLRGGRLAERGADRIVVGVEGDGDLPVGKRALVGGAVVFEDEGGAADAGSDAID
ncbi:MAG: hypothetical protein GY778_27990 [bacterium]|nr:hypothetical protein [bacterium]